MKGVFTKEFVLKSLAEKYNEYSKTAAYWHRMEHPEWDKYGTAASAVLELIQKLFIPSKYQFVFVTENISGCRFEWRKVEVL